MLKTLFLEFRFRLIWEVLIFNLFMLAVSSKDILDVKETYYSLVQPPFYSIQVSSDLSMDSTTPIATTLLFSIVNPGDL